MRRRSVSSEGASADRFRWSMEVLIAIYDGNYPSIYSFLMSMPEGMVLKLRIFYCSAVSLPPKMPCAQLIEFTL